MTNNMGEMIRLLRKEQGVTQDDLAIALNITNQSISKWENGLANPDITFIPIIAKFFGVSVETLFAYEIYAADEEYQQAAKAQRQLFLTDNIDDLIKLWESLHLKYPNDFRIEKELIVAMCRKNDKNLFDEIFAHVIAMLRKNQNVAYENEMLNALKAFLCDNNIKEKKEKSEIATTHKEIALNSNMGVSLTQSEADTLFQTVTPKKARGKNVLIVDDVAFMRTMLSEILAHNGYTIVGEASNGYEAIEAVHTLAPDIIIMDIVMPGMDGLAASKQILQENDALPIVICSAMGYHQTILSAIKLGISRFQIKPFMAEGLLKTIDALFN